MKQKYQITRDDEKQILTIREYAELDKDILSPLCEENYPMADIQKALKEKKEVLIAALRTKNMYPPGVYADRIADGVTALLRSQDQSVELFFDDIELLAAEEAAAEDLPEEEAEEDLDELLDDGYEEDELDDKEGLKKLNSSLKIADDEFGDADEEA
jgi:hypothetical protein